MHTGERLWKVVYSTQTWEELWNQAHRVKIVRENEIEKARRKEIGWKMEIFLC